LFLALRSQSRMIWTAVEVEVMAQERVSSAAVV
jgi:hypothetical protein